VVIGAVDQGHLCRCVLESLRGGQTSKAAADDDDSWLSHLSSICSVRPDELVLERRYGAAGYKDLNRTIT